MSRPVPVELVVTVDIDWASEAAIEETFAWLDSHGIHATIFSTHPSALVEEALVRHEVGLHPFFDPSSSHGPTIADTVRYVCDLPHNISAFRSHRFGVSNPIREAMIAAGMKVSSNICTDLVSLPPFRERCGLLEVPIFLEDGGYLYQEHPLHALPAALWRASRPVVIEIHPMHIAINTPAFGYMVDIKRRHTRAQWNTLGSSALRSLRWSGPTPGIRDLCDRLLDAAAGVMTLGQLVGGQTIRKTA